MLEDDKEIIFKWWRDTKEVIELKKLAEQKWIKAITVYGEGDLKMMVKWEIYSYRLREILELKRRIKAMPNVKKELTEILN